MVKTTAKLEEHLVLNSYFNGLFGVKDFLSLREKLKDIQEGYDEEGHSYFYRVLSSLDNLQISPGDLEKYDNNIREYLLHINKKRELEVKLKYFQYLSLLFTEIFLDKYFKDPLHLLENLNHQAHELNQLDFCYSYDITDTSVNDLNKLAFWMATGSGKTLVYHINYLQFMAYNRGPHKLDYDNILLITPSENLTTQHIEEMDLSSIPCELFSTSSRGYFSHLSEGSPIQVIEIHKLTEEKKGEGVSVGIEEFGSKNLVFVDEGHKGSGGKKWKDFRNKIAAEGFTFEYSATFGQAISNTPELLHEYAKSIVFDYSYKYFYNDGYGKDYRILNLKDSSYMASTKDILMLANLLSFYEQKLLFESDNVYAEEYLIENPLWIFVGSKVKGKESDIRKVVQFLDKILVNKDNWVIQSIDKIMSGKSDLIDNKDHDHFAPDYPEKKLEFLHQKKYSGEQIYQGLLSKFFHVDSKCRLHIVNLTRASGELALKAGDSSYFGVINIGDTSGFLKEIEDVTDIPVSKDNITNSLFSSINGKSSKINILIGAKKFMEGWNSWRVSNMGLLNIGKKEGVQIIQLFGRGVRLHGKENKLKRSKMIEDTPPPFIEVLETLNIFAIEANYMNQFKEYLDKEDIPSENFLKFRVPIKIEKDYLKEGLLLPDFESSKFRDEEFLTLEGNEKICVSLDLMPKVEEVSSIDGRGIRATTSNPPRKISGDLLKLLDWDKIRSELLKQKTEKGWNNINIEKGALVDILSKCDYTLHCPEEIINPKSYDKLIFLEEIVIMLLKKYLYSQYGANKNRWIQENASLIELNEINENLAFNLQERESAYEIRVNEKDVFALSEITRFIKTKLEELYVGKEKCNYLENVYFDRQIYQPILVKIPIAKGVKETVQIYPAGLNEGEKQFIEDLKAHLLSSRIDGEIFVLRNLPRKGIGFFESSHFYPDFIIWVKKEGIQHLIFVDPKGLGHMWEGLADEKIKLHETIKSLEKSIVKRTKKRVTLDSFIVSVTPYNKIRELFGNMPKSELEKNNILFQKDDKEYIKRLFAHIY